MQHTISDILCCQGESSFDLKDACCLTSNKPRITARRERSDNKPDVVDSVPMICRVHNGVMCSATTSRLNRNVFLCNFAPCVGSSLNGTEERTTLKSHQACPGTSTFILRKWLIQTCAAFCCVAKSMIFYAAAVMIHFAPWCARYDLATFPRRIALCDYSGYDAVDHFRWSTHSAQQERADFNARRIMFGIYFVRMGAYPPPRPCPIQPSDRTVGQSGSQLTIHRSGVA